MCFRLFVYLRLLHRSHVCVFVSVGCVCLCLFLSFVLSFAVFLSLRLPYLFVSLFVRPLTFGHPVRRSVVEFVCLLVCLFMRFPFVFVCLLMCFMCVCVCASLL